MSLKLEGESNDTTLPVETPRVNTANGNKLTPQIAPTSSPTVKTSKTTLPNIDQTTVSALPVFNETKLEITDGTQSSTKQPEAKNPVTPADKNQYDKPISNTETDAELSALKIMEIDIDKTGQDPINKLDKREVISEPLEQPNLTHNITNKEPLNQEQKKADPHDLPVTNHATNIRMCTVHLEILTEADIVKHVHVHKEIKSNRVLLLNQVN